MQTIRFFENVSYDENKVVVDVLVDDAISKEIRLAFAKGVAMKAHKTAYPIHVMVLEGEIIFSTDKSSAVLTQGDMVTLEGGIMHALEATKQSIIRLSLHKSDTAKRVFAL